MKQIYLRGSLSLYSRYPRLVHCLCYPCNSAISCGKPGSTEHSTQLGLDYTFSQTVKYVCHQGYELVGKAYLSCEASGNWNGSAPKCHPVPCPVLIMPAWAERNSSVFTYASAVAFKCLPGFVLRGLAVLTCQWNSTWSAPLPECIPITCGNFTPPPYMEIASSNASFAGVAVMKCQKGYEAQGGGLVASCQIDRSWSNLNGSCIGELDLLQTFPDIWTHSKLA